MGRSPKTSPKKKNIVIFSVFCGGVGGHRRKKKNRTHIFLGGTGLRGLMWFQCPVVSWLWWGLCWIAANQHIHARTRSHSQPHTAIAPPRRAPTEQQWLPHGVHSQFKAPTDVFGSLLTLLAVACFMHCMYSSFTIFLICAALRSNPSAIWIDGARGRTEGRAVEGKEGKPWDG